MAATTYASGYMQGSVGVGSFNIVVAPCVSPWGYETINRWNRNAVDPNRSFVPDSVAEESASLMLLVASLGVDILAHVDLHETTDTDETEFLPALAARDGNVPHRDGGIPDGFYVVDCSERRQPDFQKAIIDAVSHIAPQDANGEIIGAKVTQEGVIEYPTKKLGLCAGVTDAKYVCTTEVYPDSPLMDDEKCNLSQVAAVSGQHGPASYRL
eukprot:gene7759-942_t